MESMMVTMTQGLEDSVEGLHFHPGSQQQSATNAPRFAYSETALW